MSDCIFCQIIKKDIPSTIVYEDDEILAFEDINPQLPVHTLVVPKVHYAHLGDEVPQDLLGRLFSVVPLIAKLKGVDQSGYRVVVNIGEDGRQTVPHLHIHILGGALMPIRMGPAD